MTRNEKKAVIESMAEKFMNIDDLEGKSMTIAAYNYGERGAREHLWNNGVYVYSYNTAIMQRMKEIEEVVGK